jgi:hypothetical protein
MVVHRADPATPVVVWARIDSPRRWSWLYKWILAIPHLVVLLVLWVVLVVLTIVAWVSIVATGRYPEGIFGVNLGIMRWTWRVQLYAFTLSTDRYPPFSLGPEPDFPGFLDIDRPERLSRGKVWVKSWLLAIPHLVLVAIFTSSGPVGLGLVGVLSLIAGVTLGVTREYPSSIFDLVMGLHRWVWRVIAYVALMRDEYPPFRLDMGPDEPPGAPAAGEDDSSPASPLAA